MTDPKVCKVASVELVIESVEGSISGGVRYGRVFDGNNIFFSNLETCNDQTIPDADLPD